MFTKANIKLIATILVIVGALNWLGVGLQNTNYVSKFAGENASYVFTAVGVAGIYLVYLMFTNYSETGRLESYDDMEEEDYGLM
jgi:uncharacterized membrane protein YuzA (DUF378 family)